MKKRTPEHVLDSYIEKKGISDKKTEYEVLVKGLTKEAAKYWMAMIEKRDEELKKEIIKQKKILKSKRGTNPTKYINKRV